MAYCPGKSLMERIRHVWLPVDKAVDLAVVGRVDPTEGHGLRILVQLMDTAGGRLLRRRTIPWTGADGDTLQSTMVDALTDMLELELNEQQKSKLTGGGTTDRIAYERYVEALGLIRPPHELSSIDRATDLLRAALEFDTGFTLARVALAESLRWGDAGREKTNGVYGRLATLVEAELERQPDDPLLLLDLASARAQTGEEGAAREAIKHALAIGTPSCVRTLKESSTGRGTRHRE